ncbi:MAG: hypothetical protein H6807_01990 [Planctomycetes bacterium]|nr:hypothetical protein [Planctomycetota bacterium]
MSKGHISIIGNLDTEYPAHVQTREAIIHAERELGVVLNTRWVTPHEIVERDDVLDGSCAALIAPRNPKSPRQLWPEILAALEWLEARRVPTLGIEYGYQHMVIDMARRLLLQDRANSTAYDEASPYPVITRLESDQSPIDKVSPVTIDVRLRAESMLWNIYGKRHEVREAFRGHYVVNPDYLEDFEDRGVQFSARGRWGDSHFVAAFERSDLPFQIGVAYLPQFASRPGRPHPLFLALVKAGLEYRD